MTTYSKSILNPEMLLESAQITPAIFYQFKVDSNGQMSVPHFNSRLLDFYEITAKELQDNPTICIDMLHPDDKKLVLERIAACMENMSTFEYSGRIKSKTGVIKRVHANSTPVKLEDGSTVFHGVMMDTTRRSGLEDDLHKSKVRLELALRSAKLGAWDWEVQDNRLVWDETMFEIFGVDPKNFKGHYDDFIKCVHPSDVERVAGELQNSVDTRKPFTSEFRIIHPNGQVKIITAASLYLYNDDGTPNRLIGVNADVTRVRQQESQLVQNSKMSSLGEMAAGIAHEINNPLSIILGHAQTSNLMLSKGNVDASMLAYSMQAIERTVNRISKIINGLRSFAREDQQDPFRLQSVESILEDTLTFCRERFAHNQIELEVALEAKDLKMECRPTQISQVLLNLINNAFDALVDAKKKWIKILIRDSGSFVEIHVVDSGHGIPRQIRSKIMEPFFTTKEVGKGTGLGLSVATGIASSHKGHLILSDDEGPTKFILRLPKIQNLK